LLTKSLQLRVKNLHYTAIFFKYCLLFSKIISQVELEGSKNRSSRKIGDGNNIGMNNADKRKFSHCQRSVAIRPLHGHCEERSDVAIRFPSQSITARPHRSADRVVMTNLFLCFSPNFP